jgi:hypothetical protein
LLLRRRHRLALPLPLLLLLLLSLWREKEVVRHDTQTGGLHERVTSQ